MMLHPFRVGDYIMEATYQNEGTVSEISIFYTKLATIDNKTILLPNGYLADTSITNVTREENRRVELKVGISYEADIRQAKGILEELLLQEDRICKRTGNTAFMLMIWRKAPLCWACGSGPGRKISGR